MECVLPITGGRDEPLQVITSMSSSYDELPCICVSGFCLSYTVPSEDDKSGTIDILYDLFYELPFIHVFVSGVCLSYTLTCEDEISGDYGAIYNNHLVSLRFDITSIYNYFPQQKIKIY